MICIVEYTEQAVRVGTNFRRTRIRFAPAAKLINLLVSGSKRP